MNAPWIEDAKVWQDAWGIRPDTIYLNHGSFGPPPESVRAARADWQHRIDSQPMDFFVREFEPAWMAARSTLADFVGASPEDLVFVENATSGMNLVANCFPLTSSDEVLLTNHEYGAVRRIWQRACRRAGAAPPVVARLPERVESTDQVVAAIFAAATDRTRLLVTSHITSATALILPVREICLEARRRGIAVCLDGPHAPAQVPVNLRSLGCDFYTASCHKWLSAPFGSGFLAVREAYHHLCEPSMLSWGRLLPLRPEQWWEEFVWSGTRDPSAFLAIPAAIEFLQQVGLPRFRQQTHALARYARRQVVGVSGIEPPLPDSPAWYGSMALVPLPPCAARELQTQLWLRHHIEVPIVDFEERQYVRVSCHLYNTPGHIDALSAALADLL